jgi:AraC-like DNA-binding protein
VVFLTLTSTLPQNCRPRPADFSVDIHCSEHYGPGTVFARHWHEHLELLHFVAGSAQLSCGKSLLAVQPGNSIIINSDESHSCESTGTYLRYYVIEFDFSFFGSPSTDACQTNYLLPLLQNRLLFKNECPASEQLQQIIQRLIAEYTSHTYGYELAVKASIYDFLAFLLRHNIKKTLSHTAKEKQRREFARLQLTLTYMDEHCRENLRPAELAQHAKMNLSQFYRAVKCMTGTSPGDYLLQCRLKKALTCLSDPSLNITEAALISGFDDSNYFSRQFKKHYQQTPSEFRKKIFTKI